MGTCVSLRGEPSWIKSESAESINPPDVLATGPFPADLETRHAVDRRNERRKGRAGSMPHVVLERRLEFERMTFRFESAV